MSDQAFILYNNVLHAAVFTVGCVSVEQVIVVGVSGLQASLSLKWFRSVQCCMGETAGLVRLLSIKISLE